MTSLSLLEIIIIIIFSVGPIVAGLIIINNYYKKNNKSKNSTHLQPKEEKEWKDYFEYPAYTPELWAAKFGHLIGNGHSKKLIFDDPEFQKWCNRLFDIIHSNEIHKLRKELLTEEEQTAIRDHIAKNLF